MHDNSENDQRRLLAGLFAGDVTLLDEISGRVPPEALADYDVGQLYRFALDYRRRTGGILTRDAVQALAGEAGSAALLGEVYDSVRDLNAPDAAGTRWAADKVIRAHRVHTVNGLIRDVGEINRATEDRPNVADDGARRAGPDDAVRWLRDRLTEIERDTATSDSPDRLTAFSVADLRAAVAARGPRRYLLRGVWPEAAYGVLAAEAKAQKTWCAVDAAVSVASGTPWLGAVPVDVSGPVLLFAGEGGDGAILRRIDAVAASRGVEADTLPLAVVARAPHLTDTRHVMQLRALVNDHRPVLVIVDPLYLAARGADLRDLYAMGAVLETVQHVCTDAGAALLVVHHHNRGQGAGPGRMSGAGPAEWGRVLISAEVKARHADREHTGGTDVVTVLSVVGGEVPDQAWRVRRRVWADDPDALDSALNIVTTATDVVDDARGDQAEAPEGPRLSQPARTLLDALTALGTESTRDEINDRIAAGPLGNGLTKSTFSRVGAELVEAGLAVKVDGASAFAPARWRLTAWADLDTDSDGPNPVPDPVSHVSRERGSGEFGSGEVPAAPTVSRPSHTVGGTGTVGAGHGSVGADLSGLVPGLGVGHGSDSGNGSIPNTDRERDGSATVADILAATRMPSPAGDPA